MKGMKIKNPGIASFLSHGWCSSEYISKIEDRG